MGTHFVNLGGALTKQRLDSSAKPFGELKDIEGEKQDGSGHSHSHDYSKHVDYNRLVKAFNDKEGCHLNGYILINKVPGNFHMSSHAFSQILPRVMRATGISAIDLSHRINHISFGADVDLQVIK